MAVDILNDSNLSTNLVSVWLSDESGLTGDLHGSNTLTNSGATLTTGKNGDAADLEATESDCLSAADSVSLSITSDISLAAWINLESAPSNDIYTLFSKWDGTAADRAYLLDYRDDAGTKLIRFIISDGSTDNLQITHTLSTGVFVHVGVAWDASASEAEYYINGSSIGTVTGSATSIQDGGARLGIGCQDDTNDLHFDGILHQMCIWNKRLNATGFSDLYNSGNGIPYEFTGGARNALFTFGGL